MTSRNRVEMYRQCHLQRKGDDGAIYHTIGFILEKYAVPGKVLTLSIEGRKRSGWVVMSAGAELFEGRLLNDQSQDYKRMRKASDI